MELLFVNWHFNPAILNIGSFELRWYSVLFVAGFILGWFIVKWMFKREGVSEKLLDPLLYTLLIGTIVGARLGHCLFYQPDYYLGSWKGFLEIFMPWKGGLASHGGTLLLFFALLWFARHYGRKEGFDFFWLLDRLSIPVSFAAMFIRLGNLCNSEIYGNETTLPWGFIFQLRGEVVPKHPTQLYEALCYLILGLVLLYLYKRHLDKMHRGSFMGIFFIGCFGSRFLIEFIKEPQVAFEAGMSLNMGQLLSIPFIITGIVFILYAVIRKVPSVPDKPSAVPVKKEPTHYAKSLRKD